MLACWQPLCIQWYMEKGRSDSGNMEEWDCNDLKDSRRTGKKSEEGS